MYGLPKIHKDGVPLRPIISQIGSYTYDLAKFLVPILSPLMKNEYSVKDSFAFVNELSSVQNAPYMSSFDVVSLFTNIPLEETVDICLNRLYANTDKVNNISRTNLKKMILYASKESHFLLDGKIYDQIDGVSMGSPLGPILANIFMCYLETTAMSTYLGILPILYRRYVDDCFLIFGSKAQSDVFFQFLNKQHKNIQFTKDDELDNSLPFLDIHITHNDDGTLSTSIYRKPTFSGLYLKWNSFVPKQFKTGLVNCLLNRAWKICSNSDLFHQEINFIKSTLAANGYPSNFLNSCINRFLKTKTSDRIKEPQFGPKRKDIFIKLPYKGQQSDILKRQLTRLYAKVAPWLKLNFIFFASNRIKRLSKLKCQLPVAKRSHVIYKVNCSECDEFYIGLTNRRLETRLHEHFTNENSALYRHSFLTDHAINYSNPNILATDNSIFRLKIKETLKIKEHSAYNSLNGNTGSFRLNLWS